MNTALVWALWLIVILAVIAMLIVGYINVRARRLDTYLGSFRCWARRDSQSGWTAGVAHYGVETLTWYRLVGFSMRPVFSMPRRTLEVSAPDTRSVDGTMIEVHLVSGDDRWQVAMAAPSYTGLVSWAESGPPRSSQSSID